MSLRIQFNKTQKNLYRQRGYWGDATLADYWNMAALSAPEKVAVIDRQGTSYTYAELDDLAGRIASFLKETGVKPGDFVSLQLPNWTEFVVAYIGCLKAGAVVNPVVAGYRSDEVAYILNKCESKVLFIPAEFRNFDYLQMIRSIAAKIPCLKKVVVVEKETKVKSNVLTLSQIIRDYSPIKERSIQSADDLAAVLFTSGTEGIPKGVMLTHNNIIASERAFTANFNITYTDVLLMPAPVGHATGFHHGVTASFMVGARSVLQDIFKPEISLELIKRESCTAGMGVPSFVYDILRVLQKEKWDISSLRYFLCGGAPVPRHMVQDALEFGFKVLGVYGSTESCPHTAPRLDDPVERIICSDGVALPGVEIRVVDEFHQIIPRGVQGEEASRGPNVFVGYLKEPELTDKVLDNEGWYYSGDLCSMDDEGYIRITGRKKDVIIRGGENISCVEIENILLQHPNIREAGVVAMPDPRLGERTCAYVVLNDPNLGLTLEEIKCFFASKKVAKCKYPERIEIVKCLPRTASGKIRKYLLREDIQSKLHSKGM